MAKPRAATAVDCPVCGKTISRKADLPRHMKIHAANKGSFMHACPHPGCPYRALQRSNLLTHLNVHSGKKPNKCPEPGCAFSTADPGSLVRHRRELHGYKPKGSSSAETDESANHRRAARRRRRISPYPTSSHDSPTHSGSSSDPSSPSLSTLPADDQVEEGSKNDRSVCRTKLIAQRVQVNDSLEVPQFHTGPLPTSETSAAERPQLPASTQGSFYDADVSVQPVSEATASEEILDNFLARFGDWQPAAPSLPNPISYNVDNVSAATLPQHAADDSYTSVSSAHPPYAVDETTPLPSSVSPHVIGNLSLPTTAYPSGTTDDGFIPTTASLRSCDVHGTIEDTSHEYSNSTSEAASDDAQFSQPDLFASMDMGLYPQAMYPQDIDEGFFYANYAGSSNFAMPGFYTD